MSTHREEVSLSLNKSKAQVDIARKFLVGDEKDVDILQGATALRAAIDHLEEAVDRLMMLSSKALDEVLDS